MPKKLLIFPFGGNAREAAAIIEHINEIDRKWDVIGFIDDVAVLSLVIHQIHHDLDKYKAWKEQQEMAVS